MRKIASHKVSIPHLSLTLIQHYLVIDEMGKVLSWHPLTEELPMTEWIDAEILVTRSMEAIIQ